jgi:hypothetical protein
MITSKTSKGRKKMNFMIGDDLAIQIKTYIPSGQWSDFVNDAIAEAILRHKRQKAVVLIDELREKSSVSMTTAEMIKRKNYGRP